MDTAIIILDAILLVIMIIVMIKLFAQKKPDDAADKLSDEMRELLGQSERNMRSDISDNIKTMSDSLTNLMKVNSDAQNTKLNDTDNQLSQKISDLKTQMDKEVSSLKADTSEKLESIRQAVDEKLQRALDEKMSSLGKLLTDNQKQASDAQYKQLTILENRFKTLESGNEQKLDEMRHTMLRQLTSIQEENQKKLDSIQSTVNEKLESQLQRSFKLVSDQLETVHKSLGEMQTIASGVGDLKKVLSNVKTRGILGEIQLGNILEEILAPEQYDKEVVTVKGSTERVEYAIKLPGQVEGKFVYLPIDSKFPGDTYQQLIDAQESGNKDLIEAAKKNLVTRIKGCAKAIATKYVSPPDTTNFGIMFLPFEGLYAEVVNLGLIETLQNEFRINITGPSTMAAMLNSLQMGFRTLAIQKKSGEVWEILGAVKKEFANFQDVLDKAQKQLHDASSNLDLLIGRRTNAINRKLRTVETLEDQEKVKLILEE